MSPASALDEQAGPEDERAERRATPRRPAGSASAARSDPTARHRVAGPGRGAASHSPSVSLVEPARRRRGVEAHQRERRARARRARSRERQVRVARERAGQVQRRRQRARGAARTARRPGFSTGISQARLDRRRDARCRAARAARGRRCSSAGTRAGRCPSAGRRARTSRPRRRACAGPRERHPRAGGGAVERRGDARRARRRPRRRARAGAHAPRPRAALRARDPAPSRAPAATCARASACCGSRLDALEQPAVDAGHRQHAGGAAPVEQRRELMPRSNHCCARVRLESAPARHASSAARSPRGAPPSPPPSPRAAACASAASRSAAPRVVAVAEQAEAPQVLGRQVHAAVLGVLAHVAQDVRQLHRHAEIVGERFGAGRAQRRRAAPKIARHTRPIAPATRRQ